MYPGPELYYIALLGEINEQSCNCCDVIRPVISLLTVLFSITLQMHLSQPREVSVQFYLSY